MRYDKRYELVVDLAVFAGRGLVAGMACQQILEQGTDK